MEYLFIVIYTLLNFKLSATLYSFIKELKVDIQELKSEKDKNKGIHNERDH